MVFRVPGPKNRKNLKGGYKNENEKGIGPDSLRSAYT